MAIQTETREITISPYGVKPDGSSFPPRPTQQTVLDWVDRVRAKKHPKPGLPVLYLQGGVGAGKTSAIFAPAIECLHEYPGLRILDGREDFSNLRISAMETFFEIYPPQLLKEQDRQEHRYKVYNGSQIFFRNLKDLSGLGSTPFGIVLIHEVHEITEKAYRTLKDRCRQSGMPNMILMEGNPPNEDHWLYKLTQGKPHEIDPDIDYLEVTSYENWDALPAPYRHSLENSPASWRNKYLLGKFGFTPDGDPFYQGFKSDLHVKDLVFNSNQVVIRGWDYGFHHPAVSFHQIQTNERWCILKEFMGTNVTIDRFADQIINFSNDMFPKAQFMDFGDPAGEQVNDKSEKTSVQILQTKGINVVSKVSDYRERKEIIERKLSMLIDGSPALTVDRSCRIIIDGFQGGYHYPQRKENQAFGFKYEIPYKDGLYELLMNSMEFVSVNAFTGAVTRREPDPPPQRFEGKFGKFPKDPPPVEQDDSGYRRWQRDVQPVHRVLA